MSGRQLAGFGRRYLQTKTANYTVTKADVASVIVATGSSSWTLALPAAASVGNGFIVTLKNAGTGRITIDPNGSETVNGALTIGCYMQDSADLICDGTGWQALFQSPYAIVSSAILGSPVALLDLTMPSELKSYELELEGFEPSAIGALALRFSIDGGSTFYSTGGNYAWNGSFDTGSTTNSTTYKSASGSTYTSTALELTPGTQVAANGSAMKSIIRFSTRTTGRFGDCQWFTQITSFSYRGAGYLGISSSDLNALRLQYSGSANIVAGSKYTLIGRRG